MVADDDLKWIDGFCNNEEWAVSEILKRIRLNLKRWRTRLSDRSDDAENISYINLHEYICKPDFFLQRNLNALIRVIVNHICLDMVRGRTIRFDDNLEGIELPDGMANPEEMLEIRERGRITRDMLMLLDTKCRRLFILHFVGGKKLKEIAELMKSTESAIKQLMMKCKRKAQKILNNHFGIDRLF